MSRQLTPRETAERSLIKTYRKTLWNPFIAAVKRYELVSPGDHIAVCISGGKDSMVLAKLMQELQKHTDQPFELTFLVMDPGYNPANRRLIEENAARLEIPVTIFESDIFDVTVQVDKNPCYLCARMRRGCLYAKARELGCNKIALGHHFSDVVETTLLGLFYGAQLQAMPPQQKFPGHGADPPPLLRPRGRRDRLEELQPPAIPPVRLPLYGGPGRLRRRRGREQAAGDEGAAAGAEAHQPQH